MTGGLYFDLNFRGSVFIVQILESCRLETQGSTPNTAFFLSGRGRGVCILESVFRRGTVFLAVYFWKWCISAVYFAHRTGSQPLKFRGGLDFWTPLGRGDCIFTGYRLYLYGGWTGFIRWVGWINPVLKKKSPPPGVWIICAAALRRRLPPPLLLRARANS